MIGVTAIGAGGLWGLRHRSVSNARRLARDTERKRIEEVLRESEARFRLMADAAPLMVWTSDPSGARDYVNHAWLAFIGRPLAAELGDGWADGVHADDRPRSIERFRHAIDAREPFQIEYRLRRHDRVYRRIRDAGAPRHMPDGTYAGYVGAAIDVTELRTAQQALSNLSQKLMEAQEHERTRIARELHDDIGQRAALLSIDLDRLGQTLPPEATDVRGRVAELGRRAVDLEKDVQAMSHRLHSSKLELLGIALAVA